MRTELHPGLLTIARRAALGFRAGRLPWLVVVVVVVVGACVFAWPGQVRAQLTRSDTWLDDRYAREAEAHGPSMRFAPSRDDGPQYHVRRVNADSLVVYRARSGTAGLEGFLVDLPSLYLSLHERVLTERGLGDVATLSMHAPTASPAGAFSFGYELLPPFTPLRATLLLRPLEQGEEASLLFVLAGLLAAVIVGGLFALYRMVAVQIEFTERRSNFVSAVSHELKTPLTAIRMYGEILREGMVEDDAKRAEYYGLITSESERLSRLVNNVLELANIERGARSRKALRGDPSESVRQAVQVMQGQAKERGFELVLSLDNSLPSVEHDPDGLKQVLFNLLDNALKYGRDSTIKRIDVRCAQVGRGVRISVRDHGPGVDPVHLSHLFEAFYRAESELTRRHEGVGLGLALVQRIAQEMRAEVACQNASPGFEVSLQLRA